MICRTPRCRAEAHGGRWCEEHAAFYARVRKELDEAEPHRPRSIHRSCSSYECFDPRKPGSKFCLKHDRELAA